MLKMVSCFLGGKYVIPLNEYFFSQYTENQYIKNAVCSQKSTTPKKIKLIMLIILKTV
jgi:hypothetical protein